MVYTIRLLRFVLRVDHEVGDALGHSGLEISGGDALRGNTRSHPEHDG